MLGDNLTQTVLVYLCICVFGCQTLGNIVFEVLVRFPFQKYITSWVFSGFCYSGAISGMGWDGWMGWISVWGDYMSTALRC